MKRSLSISIAALLMAVCSLFSACASSSGNKTPGPAGPNTPSATLDKTPVIYIHTDDEAEIPVTKEAINCSVTLVSKDDKDCANNLRATVRCRGNGSMTVGKRTGKFPYKLKFNKKINLFGLGEGASKDWVLLANVGDQSMLRNYAAKLLGKKLTGIPFSPSSRLVNVYLNDEYIGVYELTEQMEVNEYRVNINDSQTGKENDFLVELDAYAKNPEEGDLSILIGEQYYTVKSDVYNDHQLNYIRQTLTQIENAIFSGDEKIISELVDIDSLVDMYVLQEYAKNIDVGFSSFYMYKTVKGKLCFAPPWDFDLSFGNDARLDDGSPDGLYVGIGRPDFRQNHLWYIALFQNEWFVELVSKRWAEVTDTIIPEVIAEVSATAALIEEDMGYNYERWNFLGKKQQQEPEAIVALLTYKEHADYLISWMESRKAWLDTYFAL